MKIYVDQSGHVEYTSRDTVVAFTNSEEGTLRIKAETKRQLQEIFRRQGKPTLFVYRTFACLVFLLLTAHQKTITDVVIDPEYPGKEKLIKDIILELFRKQKKKEPEIHFQRIGNHPKVHYLALDTFNRRKRPGHEVELEEIKVLAMKKDRGPRD